MNMKYFRFLYGETAGCFTHFGELNDTLTKERIAFLYLSGVRGRKDEMNSEYSLFLYPERLDLVVLGEMSQDTTDALKGVLEKTKIETLVVPEKYVEALKECLGDKMASVGNVILLGTEEHSSYETSMCGWKFFAKCSEEHELILIHSMAETGFGDVVMNVKNIRNGSVCQKKCSPDEFGCTYGCTIHRDYHECKYRKKDENGIMCRNGSVLMGREMAKSRKNPSPFKENDGVDWLEALFVESGIKKEAIRFFGFSGIVWKEMCRESSLAEKDCLSETEYFIGSDSEVENDVIAAVCRSGLNRIPVLLNDGQGICCSGFFKYKEIN